MKKYWFVLILIVFVVSNVSAYKLYCLNYGQSLPSQENPRYTCFHDVCQVCTTDANNPTHPARCNDIGSCQTFGGGGNVDAEPPNINLVSPADNGVYGSREVLFDIRLSEPSSLTYTDNINGRGRIKNLASNVVNYFRELNFKEGLNDITIFAKDRNGNKAEKRIKFFVDNKNPRIINTFPSKGFANGIFDVEFIEENPKKLTINYGNEETGFRNSELNLDDCSTDRGKYMCSVVLNLNDYDGEISYWFELEDISGKIGKSKVIELIADTKSPILLNRDSFWVQGLGNNKNIYFDLSIDEDNFKEVVYIDNKDRRPSEKRLCTRLIENSCVKKVSFRNGHHEIEIMIRDKAGNVFVPDIVSFDV